MKSTSHIYRVLLAIADAGGQGTTNTEIAGSVNVEQLDASKVAVYTSTLVEKLLVRRVEEMTDGRRRFRLTITDTGRDLIAQLGAPGSAPPPPAPTPARPPRSEVDQVVAAIAKKIERPAAPTTKGKANAIDPAEFDFGIYPVDGSMTIRHDGVVLVLLPHWARRMYEAMAKHFGPARA